MDDYVDVAERIRQFFEKYPDGCLRAKHEPKLMQVGDKTFLVYTALAYRTAEDKLPAEGRAWEPVPGPTQFTRDSELMNAETAAWGRALVALGFVAKKVASQQEVRSRQPDASPAPAGPPPISLERSAAIFNRLGEARATTQQIRVMLVSAGVPGGAGMQPARFQAVIGGMDAKTATKFELALAKLPVAA